MTQPEVDYTLVLRRRGYRMTPQRAIVLAALGRQDGHIPLDEILRQVQERSSTMTRTTISRTLEFLSQEGLVYSAELSGQKVYEIARCPHHHLLCRQCGALLTLPPEAVEPILAGLKSAYGFTVRPIHLILTGYCRSCGEPLDDAPALSQPQLAPQPT